MQANDSYNVIAKLSEQIARIETNSPDNHGKGVSSGYRQLDALLPNGGFIPGTLIEWLEADSGNGAFTLALLVARELCRQGGVCAVVDQKNRFYPPAAVGWGLPQNQLVVVRPKNDSDEIWALTQILRCRHVAAVLCYRNHYEPFAFRRLQLAAETGQTVGCLIRSREMESLPSWANVRLLVSACIAEPNAREGTRDRCLKVRTLDSHMHHKAGIAEIKLSNAHTTVRNIRIAAP